MRLVLLTVLTLPCCSYGAFTNLEERAPAIRISQDGEVSSSSFGDHLVGLARTDGQPGALLGITGTGPPSLAKALFSDSGDLASTHADNAQVKDQLDDPNTITGMAPAPSGKAIGSFQGPFVYLATTSGSTGNTVRVMDISVLKAAGGVFEAPAHPVPVSEFGLSVTMANLGNSGSHDDLAVGASDAVVLMRAASGTLQWPVMDDKLVVVTGAPDWPVGKYTVLAAGNLDTSTPEDEIVASIPDRNIVVIIHHTEDCFSGPSGTCATFLKLKPPENVERFGQALLVIDSRQELVVGNPDGNDVFIYKLEHKHFDGTHDAPTPKRIEGPEGALGFGKALALGKVTGGAFDLLAVSAPRTAVDGVTGAGKIYLYTYTDDPALISEGVTLASPEEDTLLGQSLCILPFKASDTIHDVLVASGRRDVFVFFANLTGESHKDVRDR